MEYSANAGQMCWAGSRLIVHEDVHDELVDAIVAEISKWPVGPGMEDGVRMGSMVHTSHRDDVLNMLNKGLEQGGEIACGGNALDRDGAMEATVVTGVSSDNLLFQEELFGPVLAVTKFSEESEALSTRKRHSIRFVERNLDERSISCTQVCKRC